MISYLFIMKKTQAARDLMEVYVPHMTLVYTASHYYAYEWDTQGAPIEDIMGTIASEMLAMTRVQIAL